MGKKKENFMQSSRSHWLKLSLESFQKNLVVDSIEIKTHIEEDQNNLDISRRSVITMIEGPLHQDSALVLMSVIATFNNLNLQNSTYESIVNSGNLGLIRDYDLREELVNYYRYQSAIRDVEQVYNDYITDYVIPLFFNSVDMLAGTFAEGFRTDSREFKNITAGYYMLVQQKMDLLLEVDSVNNALIPKVARARK